MLMGYLEEWSTDAAQRAPGASKAARELRKARKARQAVAKADCLVKISELVVVNARLQGKLDEWEHWFYGGRTEYRSRMEAIGPIISERLDAAAYGRQPHVSGSARLRRHVAEHEFSVDFREAARSEWPEAGSAG